VNLLDYTKGTLITPLFKDFRSLIIGISEGNRIGSTNRLTCCLNFTIYKTSALFFGFKFTNLNTLHTEGTFLNDTT